MPRVHRVLTGVAVALGLACRGKVETAAAPERHAAAEAAARDAIAGERAIDASSIPPRTVGVAPLSVRSTDTLIAPLGYGLADLLITDLSRSSQIQVVDRLRVDALLRELKLGQSGAIDPQQAPRVGKLLGARRMTVGSLTQLPGEQIRIDARIADVQTGEIGVGGPISASASLDQILDAEKQLAYRFFERLGVTLTPAERAAVEQRPTKNIGAFFAYSRGVRAEAMGDYAGAADQYGEAARRDPGFSLAASRLGGLPPRTRGSGARAGGLGGARLARAGRIAAGEINRSLADRFIREHPQIGGVSDATFETTQAVAISIVIRVLP